MSAQKTDTDQRGQWPRLASVAAWALPRLTIIVLLGLWLSTALVIVPLDEVALYRRMGHYQKQTLSPGLHFILPYPFGETACVNVKQTSMVPIGFDLDLARLNDTPMTWTQQHGNEHPMLVGNGTEIVVVNGLLRFKFKDDFASVFDSITASRSPSEIVRSLAHKAIFGQLNHLSMDRILKADRAALESRLLERTRALADAYNLGIEIVDFGLISIHPPVNVAPAYLKVVEASIKAEGLVSQEIIDAQRELLRCQKSVVDGNSDALAARQRQLADVAEKVSQYQTWRELYRHGPRLVQQQMFFESLEEALDRKPLVLMDANLPSTTKVWIEPKE